MNFKELFNAKKNDAADTPQQRETRMQHRQYEFSRISKIFPTHSYINVKEAAGTPPDKYLVVYHVDGLTQNGKSIEAKSEHTLELTLPDKYPAEPPKARMVTALFHPNVSAEMIDLKGIWTPETSLADCLVRIGELIAFQRYSTDAPLNGDAAQWVFRNKSLLPLSDVELGYTEIEENLNAFMETKTDIEAPAVEKENDAEKTKAFDDEDELGAGVAEAGTGSDTVAIVQEEVVTPPPAENTEAKPAPVEKPVESNQIDKNKNERDRRDEAMITQKNDEALSKEPVKEKIISKPVSAQIGIGDDASVHPSEILQELGVETPVEKTAEQRKTRVYKIDSTHGVHAGAHGAEKSVIPSSFIPPRYAPSPGGPYCSHCGSHVDEYANFCARCGSKLKIKSSQKVARIFFIVGMIAIPILIFQVGTVIFLLNKKLSSPSPAAEMVAPSAEQAAVEQPVAAKEKKTIVRMEPAPAPVAEKPVAPVSAAKKEMPAPAPEQSKPVAAKIETPKAAAATEAPKHAPATARIEPQKPASAALEAPKPAAVKVETPKPPVAVETPKPAAARVDAPKPAPVAAETPKPAPVAVEAPRPAPAAPAAAEAPAAPAPTSTEKKKAAVDGYLSGSATPPPEIAKNAAANQSAVTDNLKLARLYMGIGSYDDAISRFREVVKVDPYNQEAIQGLMQAKKMKAALSGAK
jgi:hypothetical protein